MSADVASQIQAYLRTAAGNGRELLRVGPFLASFDPHNDNPFVNYAIPDEAALPTLDETEALIAAYRERERMPRLEYVPNLAPEVEAILTGAGFVAEMRTPLMTCGTREVSLMPPLEGFDLLHPETDTDYAGMASAQMEAFGVAGSPGSDEIARLRKSVGRGSIMILARDLASGEVAGGGVCTVPNGGITEVAGIGVRPKYRRRGIAGALTVGLTKAAFEAGVTLAFLMAGHDDGARVYARAGYRTVGEVLHISHPR